MNKIAQFEKISYKQFLNDGLELPIGETDEETLKLIYDNIKIPKRATTGSAGYDFYTPTGFTLCPGETIKIPTGIRCKMDNDWVLVIAPRSGLGFKYRLQLDNTVGIIDSDYYGAKNEGHIMIKITNDSRTNKILTINQGDAIAQGIFLPYGITVDDNTDGIRIGGLGSTSEF